jgi:hypothetical protein
MHVHVLQQAAPTTVLLRKLQHGVSFAAAGDDAAASPSQHTGIAS